MLKKVYVVIVILIVGITLPRFFIADKAPSSRSEGPQCPKNEIGIFLDNPFQKLMLSVGGLQILLNNNDEQFKVRAYTIFGIPFGEFKVNGCYGSVTKLK